jgi:hypothetical protein
MKKFILICLLLGLQGCALIDAYLMTKYDPNEYQMITVIRAQAQQAKSNCDNLDQSKNTSLKVTTDSHMFMLYSEHIPRNKDLIEASKNLHAIAKGLSDQYIKSEKVSAAFCRIKFQNIETSADKIQTVVAGRPR